MLANSAESRTWECWPQAKTTTGAEVLMVQGYLRGPEGPLFHGCANIWGVVRAGGVRTFRSSRQTSQPGTGLHPFKLASLCYHRGSASHGLCAGFPQSL